MAHCLREIGIAFLFAITLHPAMKHAAGPRRELGIRTIFNILGPLANPARARHGVLGVYHAALVPVVARAAQGLGAERLWVVHGRDGLDELSLTGPSLVAEIRDGVIRECEMTPEDGGLSRHPAETLRGGDAAANAAIIRSILGGSRGAPRDIVALNAGAALLNGGQAENLRDGVALALRAIDSGAAAEKLERLVKITNEA
jgi:anthranilate phosphoribosyltransferase